MTNKSFQFKQFEVFQDRTAMKVGVDSVLLGAWVKCEHAKFILDIGTGSGIIALMLAQRNHDAMIEAIEIEENAADQAGENFLLSPWRNRLQVFHTSLQQFKTKIKFDLIVSNPPYFENALKTPSAERNLARHTDHLSFEEIFHFGKEMLSLTGKFGFIIPVSEEKRMREAALREGFYPAEICYVCTLAHKPPKRVLITFDRITDRPETRYISIKNENDTFTEEYIVLTKDFYLKFDN